MIQSTLISLLLMAIMMVCQSCGKPVNDLTGQGRAPAVELITPATVILVSTFNLNTTDAALTLGSNYIENFTFPTLGLATIPSKIYVQEGNAGNFQAKLKFKMSAPEFNIECRYFGGASTQSPTSPSEFEKGLSYDFDDCYDFLGRALHLNSQEEIWLDAGNQIELEVLGADPRFGTIIKSLIDVDWR